MANHVKAPTWGELLLQHVIVFLICVVFPGLTTLFAPASWITLRRDTNNINCTARTCVFFVVPFKTQQVVRLVSVDSHEKAGHSENKRKHGRSTNETVDVQGQGFLELKGNDDRIVEVEVSPASLPNAVDKIQQFLDSNDTSRTIFVIANWKFGAIMGGILSCFTVLYVIGYSLSALTFVWKKLRRSRTVA